MYKFLLCWRYLLTRYLALVCIVSVMLGVATLIVVNSVMSGFSTKLKERLHGLLSDVIIESYGMDGFPDPDEKMRRVLNSAIGPEVEAISPVVEVFAMIQFRAQPYGDVVTRPVRLIGVDPVSRSKVGGFAEYLLDPARREKPSFDLSLEAIRRQALHHPAPPLPPPTISEPSDGPPEPDAPPSSPKIARGAILGAAIASYRQHKKQPNEQAKEVFLLQPGDDVIITTVSAGQLRPVYDRFAVADYFKSEMSEYDSNYVYVPLDYLQQLRAMEGRVTALQIRLKDTSKATATAAALRLLFPTSNYQVHSWEEKQGPLLSAIAVERGILNVVLFMIVLVAGFGILSIFSMIVVEKTRDIGILKALGASTTGVMSIFLAYGLLLGLIGAGLGTGLGLWITENINEIEKTLTKISGHEVFPRDVYYFDKIPTDVQGWNVLAINLGAVGIAVLFSILPAMRAAWLQPVRALRYE